MKLTYYSYYPYNREDCKFTTVGKSDVPDFSFKLLKSAVCEIEESMDEIEFLNLVYEVLDCPNYHGVKNFNKPFTLDGVYVTENNNLYGATNVYDGVYVFNDSSYYVKTYDGFTKYKYREDAVLRCFNNNASYEIVDFRLQTLEEHNNSIK